MECQARLFQEIGAFGFPLDLPVIGAVLHLKPYFPAGLCTTSTITNHRRSMQHNHNMENNNQTKKHSIYC